MNKQSLLVLFSSISLLLLVAQAAFADNNIQQLDRTPASNLVSERGITLDAFPENLHDYNPKPEKPNSVNITTSNKTVEQGSLNHWYSAIDFGTNAVYATSGRYIFSSSSGMQVTGKVGYTMNGPRMELESSVGSLDSGSGSFNGTGINAYYDFQTGSTRPYIGVGYGFGSLASGGRSESLTILQSKLGVSFESSPGNNFYLELRGVRSSESNSAGIASFNVGNTYRF